MKNIDSKKISKADDDAKKLIIEVMGDELTGGFDIDSIYKMPDGTWLVMEFLKCDTVRPFDSHPNRYWFKNSQKFISLWSITQELKGELVLVNYEDSREQFLIIKVKNIDNNKGIIDEEKIKMNFNEFKDYFISLNRKSRGIQ